MKQKKRLDIIFCEKETKGTSHLRSWSGEQFLFFGTTAGASQSQWWHERDKVMTFSSLSMPAIFVVARMNSGYTAPDAHWEHPCTLRDRLSHSKYSLKPERTDILHHTLVQSWIFKEQSSFSLAEMPPRYRNKIRQKVWSKSLACSDKPYQILFLLWSLEGNALPIYSFLRGSFINENWILII